MHPESNPRDGRQPASDSTDTDRLQRKRGSGGLDDVTPIPGVADPDYHSILSDSQIDDPGELDPRDLPTGARPELPSDEKSPGYERRYRWALWLAFVVLALYGRTVFYPFTNWDDPIYIYRDNPYLRAFTLDNILALFTPGKVPREMIYIPLTYFSHLIEGSFFGLRPGVVHGVNVLLHLANTLLVYTFIGRLIRDWRVAGLAALIFAIHPLQAEAVCWAMGRKDLLSTAFALIALLAYLWRLDKYQRVGTVIAWLAFIAAVLCKPTLIIFPVLLVLLDYYRLPHVSALEWGNKIAFIAVSLTAYRLNTLIPPDPAELARSGAYRLACIPILAWDWFCRILYIQRPIAIYPWPETLHPFPVIAGVLVLALVASLLAFAVIRRLGWLLFGLLFGAVALVPAASIIFSDRDFITADRYGYFPMIALAFLLARAAVSTRRPRLLPLLALLLWIIVGAGFAIPAVHGWRDSLTMWGRVLDRYPTNALALSNLAMTYIELDSPLQAREIFQSALLSDPDDISTRCNYGYFLLDRNEVALALEQFSDAVHRAPNNPGALAGAGIALVRLERFSEARIPLERALERRPTHISARVALGTAYEREGRVNAAEALYLDGLELRPTEPRFLFALAYLYEMLNKTDQAIEYYNRTVSFDPTNDNAWYNMANLLVAINRNEDGAYAFQQALAANPRNAEASINYGILLFRAGRHGQAESLFLQGIAVGTPHAAIAHFYLGQIYLSSKDWAGAVREFEATIAANPEFQDAATELDLLRAAGHVPDPTSSPDTPAPAPDSAP